MARARNLKPGFFKNEDLAECSAFARLCFAGLWTLADREGRLEDRPKRIKGELFAFDSIEVEPLLAELASYGFIHRYKAADGRGLIQVTEFSKHQNPHHREPESDLPPPESLGLGPVGNAPKPQALVACNDTKAPDKPDASPGLDPPKSDLARGSSRADSGTLIPERGFRSPESGEPRASPSVGPPEPDGPAAAAAATPPDPPVRGQRLPKDWVLPKAWGDWALAEFPQWTADKVRREAENFRDHWCAKSGKDATKLDWLATWRKWCRSDLAHRDDPRPATGRPAGAVIDIAARNAEARRLLGFDAPPPPLEATHA